MHCFHCDEPHPTQSCPTVPAEDFVFARELLERAMPMLGKASAIDRAYTIGYLRGAGPGAGDEQLHGYRPYEEGLRHGRADWPQ